MFHPKQVRFENVVGVLLTVCHKITSYTQCTHHLFQPQLATQRYHSAKKWDRGNKVSTHVSTQFPNSCQNKLCTWMLIPTKDEQCCIVTLLQTLKLCQKLNTLLLSTVNQNCHFCCHGYNNRV